MRRWQDEQGAVAAEQVAVVTLVAVVIAAVWALGLAARVGEYGRYAVCILFDAEATCVAPGAPRDGRGGGR